MLAYGAYSLAVIILCMACVGMHIYPPVNRWVVILVAIKDFPVFLLVIAQCGIHLTYHKPGPGDVDHYNIAKEVLNSVFM